MPTKPSEPETKASPLSQEGLMGILKGKLKGFHDFIWKGHTGPWYANKKFWGVLLAVVAMMVVPAVLLSPAGPALATMMIVSMAGMIASGALFTGLSLKSVLDFRKESAAAEKTYAASAERPKDTQRASSHPQLGKHLSVERGMVIAPDGQKRPLLSKPIAAARPLVRRSDADTSRLRSTAADRDQTASALPSRDDRLSSNPTSSVHL